MKRSANQSATILTRSAENSIPYRYTDRGKHFIDIFIARCMLPTLFCLMLLLYYVKLCVNQYCYYFIIHFTCIYKLLILYIGRDNIILSSLSHAIYSRPMYVGYLCIFQLNFTKLFLFSIKVFSMNQD